MFYAIIILSSMAVISLVNCLTVANNYGYEIWQIILWTCVSTAAVIALDGLAAAIVRRLLPEKWFKGLFEWFKATKRECAFYEKIGIKKWKDKVLELGCFTSFSKSKVDSPTDNDYLLRYITEANYGVICHAAGFILGIGAVFCCPMNLWLTIGVPVVFVSTVLSSLPIFILRYNLVKLHKLYKFNEKRKRK